MTLLKHITYSLFLVAVVFMSACGQKGPLYIQESVQEASQNSAKNDKTGTSKASAESEAEPETEPKK